MLGRNFAEQDLNSKTRQPGIPAQLRMRGNNIYIAESLMKARKKLFGLALKVKKNLKFNFISTTNGRIQLKRSRDSRSIPITCESDLKKLKGCYSGQGQCHIETQVQSSPANFPEDSG